MSTTIVTTWTTDIAQLGPIYPFAGSEFLLWILGLVFWLGFHVIQWKMESRSLAEEEANAVVHQALLQKELTAETRTKD